jgi:2-methylcitrate dehydratase
MQQPFQTQQIARFALSSRYEQIDHEQIEQLKRHLLDAVASMIHASIKPAVHKLVRQITVMGEGGNCEVPFLDKLPYDRAAQLYTALVRYPDFMDNFLGKEATCHPSDNLGPLLAACHYRPATGKEFMTAMAVAYQIESRLIQEIPVMKEGIDHTLMLAYSATASPARLLDLTELQTAHALGIIGSSMSPMVTSRASYTYEWKGFISSMDASECIAAALLAKEGMTGPIALFEGPKGFGEVFGMKLDYDWSKETFELINRCVLKRYNGEVHAQPTLEAALELKAQHGFSAADIEKVDITTFLTAYHIIGSGAYGDRKHVGTKEQADHSLFYLVAVALLDGDVYPAQLEPERITRNDVQELLQKVNVNTGFPLHKPVTVAGVLDAYTRAYPDEVRSKVEIKLKNGAVYTCEKKDYHGFFTRPFTWDDVIEKFYRLTNGIIDDSSQEGLIEVISDFENAASAQQLPHLLSQVIGKSKRELVR